MFEFSIAERDTSSEQKKQKAKESSEMTYRGGGGERFLGFLDTIGEADFFFVLSGDSSVLPMLEANWIELRRPDRGGVIVLEPVLGPANEMERALRVAVGLGRLLGLA